MLTPIVYAHLYQFQSDCEEEHSDVMSYCKLVEKIYSGLPTAKEKKLFTDFAHCKEKTVHQKTLKGHHGCVNALGIGANETLLSSAGDDTRVFIWNIQDVLLNDTPKPRAIMDTNHFSNVFSTNFTPSGSRLISTGNDSQIIVHDVETGKKITRFSTSNGSFIAVSTYQSSVMPEDENIFIVCSDSPEVNVYDIRCPGREINSWKVNSELYSVDFHPNGRVFAIAGKSKIGVIDFRTGRDIYDNSLRHWLAPKGATHAKWTPTGAGLAVIRPCNVPIYIDFHDNSLTYLSDLSNAYHTRNTVKSCEFLNEQTVVTGSENFDIFMWHIDDAKNCTIDDLPDTAHVFDDSNENYIMRKTEPYTVLKGHRSIANIMKYSPKNGVLFSSGVEKIVKVWTSYPFPGSTTEPELRRMGVFPGLADDIPSDSSEDEVVLYHFDRMIEFRPLSPESDPDSESGFNVEFDMSPNGSEEDSDDDGVIFMRSSESSRRSSPEAVPIRRMVNNEPVEVDSDADDEAEDGDEAPDCMDETC